MLLCLISGEAFGLSIVYRGQSCQDTMSDPLTNQTTLNNPIESRFEVIEDNGKGIDEQIKDKIFDMFFRGNVYSRGSGLGLYLVKNAILRLNGRISFESNISQGTKFTVYVPAQ